MLRSLFDFLRVPLKKKRSFALLWRELNKKLSLNLHRTSRTSRTRNSLCNLLNIQNHKFSRSCCTSHTINSFYNFLTIQPVLRISKNHALSCHHCTRRTKNYLRHHQQCVFENILAPLSIEPKNYNILAIVSLWNSLCDFTEPKSFPCRSENHPLLPYCRLSLSKNHPKSQTFALLSIEAHFFLNYKSSLLFWNLRSFYVIYLSFYSERSTSQ